MTVLVAGLLACAPARAASSGVVLSSTRGIDQYAAAQALHVRWVRQFVGWDLAEPTPGHFAGWYLKYLRNEVANFRRRGIRVEFVTVRTPAWASSIAGNGPPNKPSSYAKFAARLGRVPHVGAIEVWNEADGPTFWANGPQPARYAPVLRAAYRAIKRVNRHVTVLTSGMIANDYGFLRSLYAHGAHGSFDGVAVHTDTACLTAPPSYFYREPNKRIGRFSFTGYRELHALMRRHGDGRKGIWITEMGWSTASTAPKSCVDGGRAGTKPAGVSEPVQAQMLTAAYHCLARDRYVKAAFWFDLEDVGTGPSYAEHLGLVRYGGSSKPAFAAMRAVNGGRVSARRCGGRPHG
jgi:hypothetical protein